MTIETNATESTSYESHTGLTQKFGLFLARFCTSAWIGAAALFVVVGVTEITKGGFDFTTKDTLVSLRFPAFYCCGAALIGCGWIGTWLAKNSPELPPSRRITAIGLLTVVLLIMAIDYVEVYLPLLRMVVPPGQAKPDNFRSYHELSKWINLTGLLICFVATLFINWPVSKRRDP